MSKQFQWLPNWLVPLAFRRWVTRQTVRPRVGKIDFGDLRQLDPISTVWGSDRGQPIDRYYIERFLAQQAGDIQGRVLEIGGNDYTRKFGGAKVTQSDVLHVAENNPGVTIIGDLSDGRNIPSEAFDCLILTQTLNAIFELPAVIQTIHRILKPGGVVLATVPGISQISRYDMDRWGYYWSFTTRSLNELFQKAFEPENLRVASHGNVLAATAFLHGLAVSELDEAELNYQHPDYQLLITLRGQK